MAVVEQTGKLVKLPRRMIRISESAYTNLRDFRGKYETYSEAIDRLFALLRVTSNFLAEATKPLTPPEEK